MQFMCDAKPQIQRSRFVFQALLLSMAAFICAAPVGLAGEPDPDAQVRGRGILERFLEVNRYWLAGPPPAVRQFSYVLNRVGGTQEFEVTNPSKTPRAKLQGVTYSALLHQLARAPRSARVTDLSVDGPRVRLTLAFDPAIRAAVGNGVENSWNGYHSLAGSEGVLVLDTNRWVPIEAQLGRLRETFDQFVQLDAEHHAPLTIRIEVGETTYAWRFRVYEPGLWLLDNAYSGDRRLAWIDQVKVNSAAGIAVHVTDASAAQARSESAGQERLAPFLLANRSWLLPSLDARHCLAYEYRQEDPYLERVTIDPEGSIMVRQEATKESPDHPTRQSLWLADGRSYTGDASDPFVKLESVPTSPAANWVQRDRLPQHLMMGLALECALTRLAREPDAFFVETRPLPGRSNRYLLVLRPKRDARLFTGTMLAFTSWCYMHDVRYDRSEILCDTATHRPIEEKDYDGNRELKGQYTFDDWLTASPDAAPGRIRAVLPYEKDGKDQALEMDAKFGFTKAGVWLLERVESRFRGGAGGSTGVVQVVANVTSDFPTSGLVLEKAKETERILNGLAQSPEHRADVTLRKSGAGDCWLKPAWTEKAKTAAREQRDDKKASPDPLIGVYRARVVENRGAPVLVELDGLSTAYWKEFATTWKVTLLDASDQRGAFATTNLAVRASRGPTPFQVRLEIPGAPSATPAPGSDASARNQPVRLLLEAQVERLTGAYHGHGLWMHFSGGD